MKNMKKTWQGLGGKQNYCAVLLFGLIVGAFVFGLYHPVQFNIIRDDYWNTTTTTTTHTTTSPITTTTTPDDGIPDEGTWFYLKVMFGFSDWVNVADYRDIWVGASDMAYVGLDGYTFPRMQSDTWYTFNTFIVELDGDIYVSMMSMIDPVDMTFSYQTELDYNHISAGYFGGYIPFYDTSAPMAAGPAGNIYWEWVEA